TTIYNGGVENVFAGGTAESTTIHTGGVENVRSGGTADLVTFLGPGATLNLDDPLGLNGIIADWGVGDVIDFLNTNVTSINNSGGTLTVTYDDNKTATYTLASQHAGFKLQSDGNGGTELVGTPIVSGESDLALLGQASAANSSLTSTGPDSTIITDPEQTRGTSVNPTLAVQV
ncbi:MAG: hypothetical protein WAM77_17640, partial [Xanthobacteraceae bacterium]